MPGDESDWLAQTHPDDRNALSQLFADGAGSTPPEKRAFVLRLRHATGAWSWFSVKVELVTPYLIATFSEFTQQRQTEAALRDSQLRYRALYSTAPLAFILWNREGYITEWNRKSEEMFGWPAEAVIGKKIHQLLLPSDQHDSFRQAVKGLTHGQSDGFFSGPAYDRQGLLLQCNWYNVALRSPQGSLIGIISLVLDVTQEILSRQRIERSEKIYRTLVETSPDAILMLDLSGHPTTINQQAQTLFGINELEDTGTSVRQLLSPDNSPDSLDFLVTPEDYAGFIANRTLRMQRLDGHAFDAAIAFTTTMDALGNPSGIVLFARDITEKLRAERELEAHRKNLEQLVRDRTLALDAVRSSLAQIIDNSPVPTFVLDAEHQLTHWNQACANITGLPASEMIKTRQQWAAFYPAARPVLADLVMTGEISEIERYYTTKYRRSMSVPDGYEAEDYFPAFDRWLFITAAPLRDGQGKVIGAIETLQDVSERKVAEKTLVDAKRLAESAASAKAEFLANVSHEIRTPMDAVIGLTHLLNKTDLTRKQHDYVDRIKGAGDILMRLINDVLDFSKIEAGRMQIEHTEFSLDSVLNNVATVVMTRAQEKGLELQYVVDPEVPARMIGDPLRLTQILVNLLSNAIKFTANGSVTAFIRAQRRGPESTLRLEVDVQDTGIGMSLEQQSRLFQAFTQADNSITRNYGGTGLGLAISKRLVELMSGRIWVTSQPGVGSTFSFEIDLALPASILAEVQREIARNKRRALVVDDNPLARTVLCRLIEKVDCQTVMAASGDEALAILEKSEQPFDYVTIDLNMPGMDGLELAAAIRSLLPVAPKLILVTSADMHPMEDAGELTQFDGALNKPVTAAQIRNLLEGAPAHIAEPVNASPLAGLRVLLAEDIPTNQLIATEMLQSMGVTVDTADNGLLVLECMRERGQFIDLILMDMQMPEMDGLEATRQLRIHYPDRPLPIIAMTAHALDQERERCLASGMNDFITKPIDPDILLGTLQRWKPARLDAAPTDHPAMTPTEITPTSDDGLPPLPGIDKVAGLKRMMNKAKLYEKILRDFHLRFANQSALIRSALNTGDINTAERQAHSTKGLAGSIGALDLQTAAKDLEEAIKSNQGFPQATFDRYERELARVIDSIRSGFNLE